MTYDYFAINYASVVGFIFLLIFLVANATLDRKIKRIFYLMTLVEFVEMVTYSLELWTTTFAVLSPLRLWFSAVGYSVRPYIFCLMLMLATRNTSVYELPKIYFVPAIVNTIASFSVFFTDIVYSYTQDNMFHRGPLGYMTHVVVLIYLIALTVIVFESNKDRSRLEMLIIFAICLLIIFSMVIEAAFKIRTVGRASLIMATIFYYMFFQTQVHHASLSEEQRIRQQLENDNRLDESTGVLKKKAFTYSAKEVLLNARNQSEFSVGFVFLDMDHLKKINDTLGHAMGDIAIADTADIIKKLCRKNDLIGRFGGDEFYIMLPEISKQRFEAILDEALVKLQRVYSVEMVSVAVTASIGAVYTQNAAELNYENLIQMADEAMYEAKMSGRNCKCMKVI